MDLKQKMRKFYCDEGMTKEHESGKYELIEDHDWWKVYARKCKVCNKVLAEKVVK